MRAGVRYVAVDPRALRTVELDSLTAIYHRASGITHVVASPVPELLAALAEPLTLPALLDRLAADYDLTDADPEALAERLTELESAGLVARA